MKKSLSLLLPLLTTLLLGVAGCDDGYSESVVYEVRTDPLKGNKIPLDPIQPDRPGQLPLLKMSDVEHVNNPYYLSNKEKNLVETGKFVDPMLATPADRAEIKTALDELYGTPANPRVGKMSDENRKLLHLTEGPEGTLVRGSKLYRIHCVHCHGVSGDGRGPTARWVNPHPRDYRQGRFKFQSVDALKQIRTPHRDDLLRVLEAGIEGTAMPSFVLLPVDEREALVSYVIHLSLRGQTEFELFNKSFKYDAASTPPLKFSDSGKIKGSVGEWYKFVVDSWVDGQKAENQIKIPEYPFHSSDAELARELFTESVARGKMIFTNPPAKYNVGTNACLTCHLDYGRRSTFREDIWGTFSKPNNLIQGVFRGGRRPVDLYRRIHSGIDPSGMIAFGSLLPVSTDFNIIVIRDPGAGAAVDKLLATPGLMKGLEGKGHRLQVLDAADTAALKKNGFDSYVKPGQPVVLFQEVSSKKIRDAVPLPATERDFHKALAAQADAIWDLVNFVQVLGSPTMRKSPEMGIYVD